MASQQLQAVTPINTNKPSASVVFVTPDMAARWLKNMPVNRKLRDADAARYARDMKAGRWEMTGEPIKFCMNGTLLDGQHRLKAVIQAGVTVPFYIVRGLAVEAQRVMDTGRKRTASDALTLSGHSNSSALAAAARLALGVNSGITDPGRFEASHAEIATFIDENPDIIYAAEFATSLARRADCPPAVVVYTYWRLARIDTFAAANFWTAAATKVEVRSGDPVLALTNRFAEARRSRERITKAIYLSLIYRAWNARRAGKTMTFIRVNSTKGGFVAIPEPK